MDITVRDSKYHLDISARVSGMGVVFYTIGITNEEGHFLGYFDGKDFNLLMEDIIHELACRKST